MDSLTQFLFRPHGKQRLTWAWIFAVLTLLMALLIVTNIFQHQYGAMCWNGFIMLVDMFFLWVNYNLYLEWKKDTNE